MECGKAGLVWKWQFKEQNSETIIQRRLAQKNPYYACKCYDFSPPFRAMNTRGYAASPMKRWYEVIPQHNNLTLEIS